MSNLSQPPSLSAHIPSHPTVSTMTTAFTVSHSSPVITVSSSSDMPQTSTMASTLASTLSILVPFLSTSTPSVLHNPLLTPQQQHQYLLPPQRHSQPCLSPSALPFTPTAVLSSSDIPQTITTATMSLNAPFLSLSIPLAHQNHFLPPSAAASIPSAPTAATTPSTPSSTAAPCCTFP